MFTYLLTQAEMGSRRFLDLTRAICEATMMDGEPHLNEIVDAFRGRRSRATVLKSVERAVEQLWLECDHRELGRIRRDWEYDQPTAKEFIIHSSRVFRGERALP